MAPPFRPSGALPAIPLAASSAYGVADPDWWDALFGSFADSSRVSEFLASGRTLPGPMRGIRFRHHCNGAEQADWRTRTRQNVAVDFGIVDISTAAFREVPPRIVLHVVSRSQFGVKISNVVFHPGDSPFRVVDHQAGMMLAPGASTGIHVELKPEMSSSDIGTVGRFLRFRAWCLVELEMGSVSAGAPITWNVMRSVIGSEVCANVVNLQKSRSLLSAEAEPFFPSQFARCFDPANEPTLLRIMDEDKADELVPEGFRRVQLKLPRPILFLPPPEDWLRGSSSGPPKPDGFSERFAAGVDGVKVGTSSLEQYKKRMQLALRLEAVGMFEDIKRYDICGAFLMRAASSSLRVKLYVPGLSESRPALVIFDPVRLRPVDQDLLASVELIARIVSVDSVNSHVTLQLPARYVHEKRVVAFLENSNDGKAQFHVRFCTGKHYEVNRRLAGAVRDLPLAVYHRLEYSPPMSAVKIAQRGLMASESLMSDAVVASYLDRLNSRQLEAVFMCMAELERNDAQNDIGNANSNAGDEAPRQSMKHAPALCIFGPPGTGKTLTLTAAIAAILVRYKGGRKILATAPSQQAADVVCERLIENFNVDPTAMFRFNPYERPVNQARATTLGHVLIKDGFFDLPSVSQLASFGVIVCSCTCAGLLDLPSDHFSAVFIDEAAQALEPEALVPIVSFASAGASIVLCGDPHQLNAEVCSEKAAKLGLQTSLMERIMQGRHEAALTSHIIQLHINYRANHPALLALPARMFYNSDLHVRPGLPPWRSFAQDMSNESHLIAPLMTIGMVSHEERVGERSPGLRNIEEACEIVEICEKLTMSHQLSQGDIGVIAPYRAQVQTIRQLLRGKRLHAVKVGTIYDYQGQEGSVIIISTTLTSDESFAEEQSRFQGFVGNSCKKFNVSITRAENLLIVVGNPHVLLRDRCWSALLRYCVQMRAYTGVTFPGMEDITVGGSGEDALVNALHGFDMGAPTFANGAAVETSATPESVYDLELAYRDEEDRDWRVTR
jgi:DNA polymerase III delta prime subunit